MNFNPTLELERLKNMSAVLDFARIGSGSRRKPKKRKRDQHLYVVGFSDAMKVGRSRDIVSRMATLQTGAMQPLQLFGYANNAGFLEGSAHKALKKFKLHGEWFYMTKDSFDIVIRDLVTVCGPVSDVNSCHGRLHSRISGSKIHFPDYLSQEVIDRILKESGCS